MQQSAYYYYLESQVHFFPYLGIPNRLRKKNEAKPASSHVSKENDAPERMPPPPAVKSQ